jgi:hypothetical protein
MSVCPVANHTRTPVGTGIIGTHRAPPSRSPPIRSPHPPPRLSEAAPRPQTQSRSPQLQAIPPKPVPRPQPSPPQNRSRHQTLCQHRASPQARARACLASPKVQQIGVDVVPARNFGNARLTRQTLRNDPFFLHQRPPTSPLRTRQNRHRAHMCPSICKLMDKHRTRDLPQEGGAHRRLTIEPISLTMIIVTHRRAVQAIGEGVGS